jgi:predicted O-methyltransferase YrrM
MSQMLATPKALNGLRPPVVRPRIAIRRPWRLARLREDAVAASAAVPGWLEPDEAATLFDLVQGLPARRPVCCELGAWLGKSSIVLGLALRARGGGTLFTIDPFTDSGEEWARRALLQQLGVAPRSRRPEFDALIRAHGLEDTVRAIQGYSFDVVSDCRQPLDLLFHDASHAYEAVKKDVLAWAPLIRKGGILVFHDYHSEPHPVHDGPRVVVNDLIRGNEDWKDSRITSGLFVTRRAKEAGLSVPPHTTSDRAASSHALDRARHGQLAERKLLRARLERPTPTGSPAVSRREGQRW